MKRILYKLYIVTMRLYWILTFGRRFLAFGEEMNITSDTIFPNYLTHPLPRGSHKSRIVRFGDYVQLHSICDFIVRANRPLNVVEVGAHHGAYAVIVGKLLAKNEGRLCAIEPHSASFAILSRNVALNHLERTVIPIQVGVSDQPGFMTVTDVGSESQVVAGPIHKGARVPVQSLANILQEINMTTVDLLIIDVEGAELPVLRSFPWGTMSKPRIYCEMHPYAWKDFGCTGSDVKAFLVQKELCCVDMYLTEFGDFEERAYIGPTVLLSRPSCN